MKTVLNGLSLFAGVVNMALGWAYVLGLVDPTLRNVAITASFSMAIACTAFVASN